MDDDNYRLERLCRAQLAFDELTGEYERALEQRNALVREALEAGFTGARVAEATGLTRMRVGQIAGDYALSRSARS